MGYKEKVVFIARKANAKKGPCDFNFFYLFLCLIFSFEDFVLVF